MNCVSFLYFTLFVAISRSQLLCSDWLKRKPMKHYPLRHCQRSTKVQISAKNVANVEKCAQFAENNFALAFNYGHGRKPKYESADHNLINLFDTQTVNRSKIEQSNTMIYRNCEILACPEVGNLSTIVNDTRYDYYSLYANPIPPANSSCLPSVGLFIFSYEDRHNYSEAKNVCAQQNGALADVLTETRTNYLSSLVLQYSSNITINAADFEITLNRSDEMSIKIPIRHAYVGLTESERSGRFISSQSKPIECYRYRAWAPKYPSNAHKLGCVAITDDRTWKMFDCSKRMPFICELNPAGPGRFPVNINRKCSLKRQNNV